MILMVIKFVGGILLLNKAAEWFRVAEHLAESG